jgi:hypothetical protein
MYKTAACCIALLLILLAFRTSSALLTPTPTPSHSHSQVRHGPDGLSLAIIAPTPTPTSEVELVITAEDAAGPKAEMAVSLVPTPTPDTEAVTAPRPAEPPMAPTPIIKAAPAPAPMAVNSGAPAALLANQSPSEGCQITNPPDSLGLDPFYKKYCSVQGLSIIASAEVSDLALQQAWESINHMLNGIAQVEEIKNSMAGLGIGIGIIGVHQAATDMPQHRNLSTLFPGVDWNNRTRAIGATVQIPLLSVAEENLLCQANNRWPGQNLLVHEFAHAIKNLGLDFVNPQFHIELQSIYQRAVDAGLWAGAYTISDVEEYWAEGVRIYFQTELDVNVPYGLPYPANTRDELQAYDPELYRMVESIFGLRDGVPLCP